MKGFSKKKATTRALRLRRTNKKTPIFSDWGSLKKGDEPTRRGGEHVAPIKNKKACLLRQAFHKKRRRHTLPQIAVPSAQAGLTSLFGMGRGEPRRNNHLKF